MKRIIPTRVVETGRLARGSSGQGVGWLQQLAVRARNLRAQLAGINERLNTPLANGQPSVAIGEQTFVADTSTTITIAQFPTNPDAVPPVAFIALQVNPIFLAGQTYRIPVLFPPPGILQAHNLVVGIEAGYTQFAGVARNGITPLNDYRALEGNGFSAGGFVGPPTTAIQYTWQQQVLGDFTTVMPFIPYFWNIVDEKSGRQYAQDWMPSGALLNTRGNMIPDSELFEFDTPWQFERDGQVSFLFRPIMDLYQIAASDATFPYGGIDDRSAGNRVEQATVRVEFHGNRYYTGQDALKDGAWLTSSDPRRHPYNLNDVNSDDDARMLERGRRPR